MHYFSIFRALFIGDRKALQINTHDQNIQIMQSHSYCPNDKAAALETKITYIFYLLLYYLSNPSYYHSIRRLYFNLL